MQVPFVDLRRDTEDVASRMMDAVMEVVQGGRFILGPQVEAFEKEFARFCDCSLGIGVASGTDALILSLRTLDPEPGSEVIVPANTFIATWDAVSDNGAIPVPVDPDPEFFTIEGQAAGAAVTDSTIAIIPVHLYGQVAEMKSLEQVSSEENIPIIEDSAQAHGARYNGRRAGSFGWTGCFSFYPSKNLGALGDGGMVVTSDAVVERRIRMLRDYGQSRKNEHLEIGFNSRLDEIQAAALRVKLTVLGGNNEKRAAAAAAYSERLVGVLGVETPKVRPGSTHIYHLFVIRCEERDGLKGHLQKRGVSTGIHYPVPPHLQPAYSQLGYKRGAFPVTERLVGEILSLPMFPSIRTDEIDYVCESIREFYGSKG